MPNTTKEVKLVISAVNASDKAFKAAAKNIDDTRKTLRSFAVVELETAHTAKLLETATYQTNKAIALADQQLSKIIVSFGTGKLTVDQAAKALLTYSGQVHETRAELGALNLGVSDQAKELDAIIDQYGQARQSIMQYGMDAEIVKVHIDELNNSIAQTPPGPLSGPMGTDAGAWWDGNIKGAKQTEEAIKKVTENFEVMGYSIRRLSSFALRAFTAFPIAIAGVLASLNQVSKEAEKLGRQDVVNAITNMQKGLETSKQVILDIPIAGKSALDWAKEFAGTLDLAVRSLAGIGLWLSAKSEEAELARMTENIGRRIVRVGEDRLPVYETVTPEMIAAQQKKADEAWALAQTGGTKLLEGQPAVLRPDQRTANKKKFEQARQDAVKAIDDLKSVISPKLRVLQQEYADLKSQPGLSPEALQAATVAFDKMSKELSVPAPIIANFRKELEKLTIQFEHSDKGIAALQRYNQAVADLIKRGQEWATQQTLMGERAAEFTSIADNAAAQIKIIQESITELSADHAKNILDLKADFEKSRAKLDAKYQSGIIDDVLAFQDKQTEMQIDLASKKADIEKESGKKLVDINDNYQKAISNIQERYEKARLKALIDRDARALFEAEQARDDDLKDANKSRQESISKESADHVEKLKAADDYYTEQADKARRAFDNQQADAAHAYQQQLDQLAQDYNDRLGLEQQNYNDELTLLSQNLANQNIFLDGALAVLDNTYQIHYNVREQNLYDHIGRMNAMQNAALTPENIYGGTYMSPTIIPTATMDYAIAQQAALDTMRTGATTTGSMDAERQRVISGGTRYAEGGYINAPLGTPVSIVAHGGEAVIPANIVPGLAAMLSGGMRVTMNIQGDGMLAQIMRGVAYDAIIEIVQ